MPGVYFIYFFLGMVNVLFICFHRRVFVGVVSFFPLAETSYEMELAYRSVRAHTLLNVNRFTDSYRC